MSTLQTLQGYYQELNKDFNELYFEVLKDFNVQAVHNMRVNIKKQNAFFHLLESIDTDFEATEPKAVFYKIFKNAGTIRKIHIEQSLLANEQLDPALVKKLNAQLRKKLKKSVDIFLYHNNTRSLLAIRNMSPGIESHILEQPEGELNEKINKYFRNLIGNLKNLAEACKKTKKAYHDLRKLLKELIHNFNLIKKIFPESNFSQEVLEYIEKLQSDLGSWHDLVQTLKTLKKLNPPPESILQILKKNAGVYVTNIRKHLESYNEFFTKIEREISFLLTSK